MQCGAAVELCIYGADTRVTTFPMSGEHLKFDENQVSNWQMKSHPKFSHRGIFARKRWLVTSDYSVGRTKTASLPSLP